MRIGIRLVLAISLVALAPSAEAQGDLDLFTASVTPSVMILFDSSGSMGTEVSPGVTRLQAAKDAITTLVNQVNPDDGSGGYTENVKFGIAKFNGSVGATILENVGADKNDILSAVNGIVATNVTPLSEALLDVARNLAGTHGLGAFSALSNDSAFDLDCRQVFVIVMTDGFPYFDENVLWSNTVGDFDQDSHPFDNTTGDGGNGFNTHWLDDIAKYIYETDIVDDSVMEGRQSIVTYTVGFALDHELLESAADETHGRGSYYTTSSASVLAQQLRDAIGDILERSQSLTAPTVPTARTAFNDAFYTAFFNPANVKPFWPGHLQAFRLTPDLNVVDRLGNAAIDPGTNKFYEPRLPFWDVAERLVDSGHPTRNLYATDLSATPPVRADFGSYVTEATLGVVAGDLSSYPVDPATGSDFATTSALATAIEGFLVGTDTFDDDGDGSASDDREEILGDIFHSNPIAIGSPPALFIDEEGYGPPTDSSTFQALYDDRPRRLYFGANDGMLHAIDAGTRRSGDNPDTTEVEDGYYDMGTGNEVFGWSPGSLVPQLKYVPSEDNAPRQYYFVDGSPNAADVWIPSSSTDVSKAGSEWHTVLMTGMRQGGDGYLALDVTNPNASSYPAFLWETYNDPADSRAFASVGFAETWSEPIITRIRHDPGTTIGDHCGEDDGEGDCRERWVAIVSAGYNAEGDPNSLSYAGPADAGWTTAGKGVFVIAIDTGEVLAKLEYDGSDSTFSQMVYAMPSTPAVLDLDFDGFADLIYVGDLGGQMWKWDISEKAEDSDADGLIDTWQGGLFFQKGSTTLSDSSLHYHSIFFPPAATLIDDELYLVFASGERANLAYAGDSGADDENRIWVVNDAEPTGADAFDYVLHEGHQTVGSTTRGLNEITTSDAKDTDTDDDGYFLKASEGQKFITNHIIFAGLFLTLAYDHGASSGNVCLGDGQTVLYALFVDNGAGVFDASVAPDGTARTLALGNGAPSDPKISVTKDSRGKAKVELIGQTSLGEVAKIPVPVDAPDVVQLVYWRHRH